jgi:hypothetical protein
MEQNVYQRFNEKLKSTLKNTPTSWATIHGVPHYVIGSDDPSAQQKLFGRPEILNIYNSSIKNIFDNFKPNQNFFSTEETMTKFKIGFSLYSVISLINEIGLSKDYELQDYFSNHLHLMQDKRAILWLTDRLSDEAFNIALKSKHVDTINGAKIYKSNSLDKRFMNNLFLRLNKCKLDCSDSLLEFLKPYKKEFKKQDYSSTLIIFLKKKHPNKLEDFKKILDIREVENSIISFSTNLISVKLNKQALYDTLPNQNFTDKEQYWKNLSHVEKFLNKEKKSLGINYCLLSGYSNSTEDFNVIVEVNENFKLTPKSFSNVILKIFELFFDNKTSKRSELELQNVRKVLDYYSLKDHLKVSNEQEKPKLKI